MPYFNGVASSDQINSLDVAALHCRPQWRCPDGHAPDNNINTKEDLSAQHTVDNLPSRLIIVHPTQSCSRQKQEQLILNMILSSVSAGSKRTKSRLVEMRRLIMCHACYAHQQIKLVDHFYCNRVCEFMTEQERTTKGKEDLQCVPEGATHRRITLPNQIKSYLTSVY